MCERCGCSTVRKIDIKQDLFSKNRSIAEKNRIKCDYSNILVVNMLSSPGSGKTTILEKTVMDLKNEFRIAVIEGDQHTNRDAVRIAKANIPVYQINTFNACHLDAHMVSQAMGKLPLNNLDVVFIENVGNLICPSEFDLGEDLKIIVASITEGEDKALKYPNTFMNASLVLLNKMDLLEILDFDFDECISFIRRVNPKVDIIPLSARTGRGIDEWYLWLKQKINKKRRDKSGHIQKVEGKNR